MNLYAYVGNNPINATDPSGKLAFFWHFGITYWAARDSGMTFGQSVSLAWDTMMVDRGTQGPTAADANQHAMLGTVGGEMQSPSQGENAINSIFTNARLPVALHAAQDCAAPLHCMQPWNPDQPTSELVNHIVEDTFPSVSTISNAYSNSMQVLNGNSLSLSTANGQTFK